jgi:hypothetical protein
MTEGCSKIQGEDTTKYGQLEKIVCSYNLVINTVRTCKKNNLVE